MGGQLSITLMLYSATVWSIHMHVWDSTTCAVASSLKNHAAIAIAHAGTIVSKCDGAAPLAREGLSDSTWIALEMLQHYVKSSVVGQGRWTDLVSGTRTAAQETKHRCPLADIPAEYESIAAGYSSTPSISGWQVAPD